MTDTITIRVREDWIDDARRALDSGDDMFNALAEIVDEVEAVIGPEENEPMPPALVVARELLLDNAASYENVREAWHTVYRHTGRWPLQVECSERNWHLLR